MKLLVVSDTHIEDPASGESDRGGQNPEPDTATELPDEVLEAALDSDGIIHAGDFTGENALGLFRGLGPPLYAVRGNMDSPGVARALGDILVFELAGLRIGLTHGNGSPVGIEDRVRRLLPAGLDVIIFGHSHRPFLKEDGDLLIMNPGSAARRLIKGNGSYGFLFVDGGRAKGDLRYL